MEDIIKTVQSPNYWVTSIAIPAIASLIFKFALDHLKLSYTFIYLKAGIILFHCCTLILLWGIGIFGYGFYSATFPDLDFGPSMNWAYCFREFLVIVLPVIFVYGHPNPIRTAPSALAFAFLASWSLIALLLIGISNIQGDLHFKEISRVVMLAHYLSVILFFVLWFFLFLIKKATEKQQ